jgi:hypothetical protein
MSISVDSFRPAGETVSLSSLLTVQSGNLGHRCASYFDFYMGGANTIRGYGIKELGAEFSGKNQLLGTGRVLAQSVPVTSLRSLEDSHAPRSGRAAVSRMPVSPGPIQVTLR